MQVTKKKMQQLHRKPNNNIPNDVIVEILLWLPAKSLLRLRWTCKYLFDLITNSNRDVHGDFIKMHLHHSTTTRTINSSSSVLSFCFRNTCILFQGHYYLSYTTDHHDVIRDVSSEVNRFDPSSVDSTPICINQILGSSNGLILMFLNEYWLSNLCNYKMCILNPCTKEYRVLPPQLLHTNFGFGVETYGFGYDRSIDDYKVIRILHYKILDSDDDDDDDAIFSHSEVEVYTLGKDSWRSSIERCPYPLPSSPGVLLNGALYWMDYTHENIISFDIGKEKFQHVAKTIDLRSDHVELKKLRVFEGSLCMVLLNNQVTRRYQSSSGEIWVIKDIHTGDNNYKESSLWTKLLSIPYMYYHFPIRYMRNGEILMLNNHNNDLVLYDPTNTSEPKSLGRFNEDFKFNTYSEPEVYTESLVSLNSGTYAQMSRTKK